MINFAQREKCLAKSAHLAPLML